MEEIKKYTDFLKPYFGKEEDAEALVKKCENVSSGKENAKFMLHQTQRLVTLADDIDKVRQRDSLKLLFLIICAEAIAKLHANYIEEIGPRKYVQNFFCEFCNLKLLNKAFRLNHKPLNMCEAIGLLYDIRCDVVHEGRYWEFYFCSLQNDSTIQESSTSSIFKEKNLIETKITYQDLRDIIVRGAIEAIKDYLTNKNNRHQSPL